MSERYMISVTTSFNDVSLMMDNLTKPEVRSWVQSFLSGSKYLTIHIQQKEGSDA